MMNLLFKTAAKAFKSAAPFKVSLTKVYAYQAVNRWKNSPGESSKRRKWYNPNSILRVWYFYSDIQNSNTEKSEGFRNFSIFFFI